MRMVGRVLLLAAPFLAVGGGLFVWLLTEHDINYYLTEKPPEYWLAVVFIGAMLVLLACTTGPLCRQLVGRCPASSL